MKTKTPDTNIYNTYSLCAFSKNSKNLVLLRNGPKISAIVPLLTEKSLISVEVHTEWINVWYTGKEYLAFWGYKSIWLWK